MKKHAYMIMAHNDFYTLEKIVMLLDDYRNDIYIHLDKKADYKEAMHLIDIVKEANVYFTKTRIDVKWGGATQVYAELTLLEEAIVKKYNYYHLISGSDLPIKSQNFIHKFFEINNGKQFVGFNNIDKERGKIKYYYFFQELAPRKTSVKSVRGIIKNILHIICRILDRILIGLQIIFKINRLRNSNYKICRGANWFSITHDLARDLVENKDILKEMYKYTAYPDEIFVQTFVYNSQYLDNVYELNNEYEGCMRFIDWNRGWPYIFRKNDFKDIIESNKIFARKFNSSVDKEIIDNIYTYVANMNKNCNEIQEKIIQ